MKNKVCCWILIGIGAFLLLAFVSTGLFLAAAFKGGRGGPAIEPHTYLLVEASGLLAEYRTTPLYATIRTHQPTLSDILRALDRAADDPRIVGVVLRPMNVLGFAEIRELRQALLDFKRSKKPIYAYLDIATDRDYYLASVADTIFVSPSRSGGLLMAGLSVSSMYLADTFEKLGLKFHVLHVGRYKGAYENLDRDRMSDELRESLQSLLDDLYRTYTGEIADGRRQISQTDLDNELMHGKHLFIVGPEAVQEKLADAALDWGDVRERLQGSDREFRTVSPTRYQRAAARATVSNKEIAVVFAEGDISFRTERALFDLNQGIYSDEMVKLLRELRENDRVAAVVLRVNSPGGSALASEIIAQEVRRLKNKKPVVVSMGNVAASGGYYISCLADRIVAQPNTITGSIGVVGVFPTAQELFRKIGARLETVEKGKWAEFFRMDRDLGPDREAVVLDLMDGVYDEFVENVAEGRKLSVDEVKAVGEGRIWTGRQALERKLVDELGGLDLAVERAKELAKISPGQAVRVRNYPREEDLFNYFMRRLQTLATQWRESLLTPEQRQYAHAIAYLNRFAGRPDFVQMIMPVDVPGCPSWFAREPELQP
jgi:protease-4